MVGPRPQPRRFREWPIMSVLACALAGLAVVAAGYFRAGTVIFAVSVLLAAALRLLLPTRQAGLLAVRARVTDALMLGMLGASLLILALAVPPPP